jgi:hypothetical protein
MRSSVTAVRNERPGGKTSPPGSAVWVPRVRGTELVAPGLGTAPDAKLLEGQADAVRREARESIDRVTQIRDQMTQKFNARF